MTYVRTNAAATRSQMLSVDAVAERLGLSSKTVRRMIDRRELTSHRIGRRVLIAEEDFALFLRVRRQ